MRATLRKKDMVAKLTCYAEFDLRGEDVDFTPGQYFFITLKPDDKEHKDELTHHFSIVNSPNQKNALAFTTRLRLDESLFKRTINDAQVGDEAEIGKVDGTFTLPEGTNKPIVLVALGIGITPYISMLRWVFEEDKPYNITLIYTDDETVSMAFLDELKQLDSGHDNFKLVCSVTGEKGWDGESRHVDGEFIKDYVDDIESPLYYISGPPKIVTSVSDSLMEAGISEDNIKTDSFTGY